MKTIKKIKLFFLKKSEELCIKLAKYHLEKAESLVRETNGRIYSDDELVKLLRHHKIRTREHSAMRDEIRLQIKRFEEQGVKYA